jgi:hypothetical protein
VRAFASGLEQIAAHATSSKGPFMVDGGGDGDSGGDRTSTSHGPPVIEARRLLVTVQKVLALWQQKRHGRRRAYQSD